MTAWNQPGEANITTNIIKHLKKHKPCEVFKMHGSSFSRSGMPDILWLYSGRAIFIEVKRPGEDPTKLQKEMMHRLTAAGAVCYVASSTADAKTIIEKHVKSL